MINLPEITELVKSLALEIGEFLRTERTGFDRSKVESKNAHDYVSYVDKNSEKKIVARLRDILPEAGFITEEGTASLEEQEYCWVVDPLDGTTNFIHNNAPYCVSIALRDRNEILVGVVYECCRDELYWAWKGSDAYLNGEVIKATKISKLDDSFIQLGFPYNADKFRGFVTKAVEKLYGNVCGLRLQGSAAAELCYIAAGRFEARVEGLLGPWDIAAGSLIVKQAGGNVTDFCGGDTFYNGKEVVASNGAIHDQLLEIISQLKEEL